MPFEQYNGEYVIVSTEKYYDEIKQQLGERKLVEYKDFSSAAKLKENIYRILQEKLRMEIKQ